MRFEQQNLYSSTQQWCVSQASGRLLTTRLSIAFFCKIVFHFLLCDGRPRISNTHDPNQIFYV